MISIYAHIPFCRQKCPYCDFYSLPKSSLPANWQTAYVSAFKEELRELTEKHSLKGAKVGTIYFGGGTPTSLSSRMLCELLNEVAKTFKIAGSPEITLETNPNSTDLRELKALREGGFNRLSIGTQSFNNANLRLLGRCHDVAAGIKSIEAAKKAGFSNIGIDLIFGLPGQSIADLERDINMAVARNVPHISAYQLTVKGALARKRFSPLTDEELSRKMWLTVDGMLKEAGFEHYEISNFARGKKNRSRHNQNYWAYGEWLGLGPSASSFLHVSPSPLEGEGWGEGKNIFGKRFTCRPNVLKYLAKEFHYNSEKIGRRSAQFEYSFLNLRTSVGIDLRKFEKMFGERFEVLNKDVIAKWIGKGFAKVSEGRFHLTIEGLLIADLLSSELS